MNFFDLRTISLAMLYKLFRRFLINTKRSELGGDQKMRKGSARKDMRKICEVVRAS
jgi:hypothetical protein